VTRTLEGLGLKPTTGLAVTGVKAALQGGSPGPSVAILGELDGLPVPGHPFADTETGAAHACGHFAQVAMMLALAMAFVDADVAPSLAGRVVFMAVPAEEGVEIEWRLSLRDDGKIEYLGGKQELIRIGAFDDVDMAMLTHASSAIAPSLLRWGGTTNGHLGKQVQFIGRAAHAGAAPYRGINALKAAMLSLAAIDAHREMFRDEDVVRVHPIITRGGDVVNSVPADVRLQAQVRANNIDALADANRKLDMALRGGALAMGARVQITTIPGYLPLLSEPILGSIYDRNAEAVVGRQWVSSGGHVAGTTDMGDLSQILPVIQPNAGGVTGTGHAPDFLISDYDAGLIIPAKAMAMTVIDVLADGAALGRLIRQEFCPALKKAEYLALLQRLATTEEYGEHPPMPSY
jgi:amidohydrolase